MPGKPAVDRITIRVVPENATRITNLKNGATQLLSDAPASQIDVLNHDFRKTNADVGSTPAVFQPLAADARVEFELATTDPSGNPTPPQPAPGLWVSTSPPEGYLWRSASKATSAFVSALFWVRIVRISSLVGSSRRSQVGRP